MAAVDGGVTARAGNISYTIRAGRILVDFATRVRKTIVNVCSACRVFKTCIALAGVVKSGRIEISIAINAFAMMVAGFARTKAVIDIVAAIRAIKPRFALAYCTIHYTYAVSGIFTGVRNVAAIIVERGGGDRSSGNGCACNRR